MQEECERNVRGTKGERGSERTRGCMKERARVWLGVFVHACKGARACACVCLSACVFTHIRSVSLFMCHSTVEKISRSSSLKRSIRRASAKCRAAASYLTSSKFALASWHWTQAVPRWLGGRERKTAIASSLLYLRMEER